MFWSFSSNKKLQQHETRWFSFIIIILFISRFLTKDINNCCRALFICGVVFGIRKAFLLLIVVVVVSSFVVLLVLLYPLELPSSSLFSAVQPSKFILKKIEKEKIWATLDFFNYLLSINQLTEDVSNFCRGLEGPGSFILVGCRCCRGLQGPASLLVDDCCWGP